MNRIQTDSSLKGREYTILSCEQSESRNSEAVASGLVIRTNETGEDPPLVAAEDDELEAIDINQIKTYNTVESQEMEEGNIMTVPDEDVKLLHKDLVTFNTSQKKLAL